MVSKSNSYISQLNEGAEFSQRMCVFALHRYKNVLLYSIVFTFLNKCFIVLSCTRFENILLKYLRILFV